MTSHYDIVIAGAGIIGLSTAYALNNISDKSILILECEKEIASQQTGHNSGVIHAGIYYKPNSLKAKLCIEGRKKMIQFASENGIESEICGKIILATNEGELPLLNNIFERSQKNGLNGILKIDKNQIGDFEPHCQGIAALYVPDTGIIDYKKVAHALKNKLEKKGIVVHTQESMTALLTDGNQLRIETNNQIISTHYFINCAGLFADRIARQCGVDPRMQIVPFRGEYYKLKKEKEHLVKNLIYPVPDPNFPFLGVHFTRMIHGGIEAGPNASLALRRDGYHRFSFSLRDTAESLAYEGFQKMAQRHFKMGLEEFKRTHSKKLFVAALQKLIPEISANDVERHSCGIRAQAILKSGDLVDDFYLLQDKNCLHVLNAPSPAATASLSIGETLAKTALRRFGL